MSAHHMPSIPGYTLTTQLSFENRTAVYRAISEAHGEPVIIKVLQWSPTDRQPLHSQPINALARFRNQYIITKNLAVPGIVPPLAFFPWNQSYALVMKDVGGSNLRDYLHTHNRLSIHQIMVIALQLADSLHHLNQHRVVHQNINPANILIHPDTHQVWLTDFSLATLLPKESQDLPNSRPLEGTLAYIAPEQTGRMNRGIDSRTDFYSLGVTLYEVLTGERPFQSDDPMQLIHCHIAKPPVPPCDCPLFPDRIPQPLSDIVLKLMAKNAEDRYQSALGLKHDLQQCLDHWETAGQIESFALGQRDQCARFRIPEKHYGRDAETQTLLDAFNQTAQGAAALMLVTGHSGIGKTTVVNAVHQPIIEKHGYFVQGKYDQLSCNIPFSAFVQAFRDLMEQLLGQSDLQLQAWKAKILETLGKSGQVLIDVIPELEAIIGPQPSVPKLSDSAAQNRFNLLLEKFIAVFATQNHPLVIVLDDLQWADAASLNLLNVLIGGPQTKYLLLLGTYRDNEVFPTHPLMHTLRELETQKSTISTITLAPLSNTHINQLVAETLSCTLELATPLADLIYQKTQGNPFVTIQYLNGLYEDGAITFNHNRGYWECDLVQIKDAALTGDAVKLMVKRLCQLPAETQTVLKLAACIGNQFDLESLAIICGNPLEDVAANLWSALQAGLVLPQSQSYPFSQERDGNEETIKDVAMGYRFLHDQVQQAAYALISDAQKARTHCQIGQRLIQAIPLTDHPNHIFAIVGQLNQGISMLSTQEERDDLAQLNLMACQQARNSTAYRASYGYAQVGLSLLGDASAWPRQYDIALTLHEALATAALLCGEYDVMEATVASIIDHAQSVIEQVAAYLILIQGKIFQNQRGQAVEIGLTLLEKLGSSLPLEPTEADVNQQLGHVAQKLEDISIPDLGHLPGITDAAAMASIRVATSLFGAAYVMAPPLFLLLAAFSVEQSIRFGNADFSAFAYAGYGIVACTGLNDIERGRQMGQLAQDIVDQFNAQIVKPKVNLIAGGFIVHRYTHVRDTLPLLKTGYLSALDVGDLEYAGINGHVLCHHLFWSGQCLNDLVSESQHYYDSLLRFHQPVTAQYCNLPLQAALCLKNGSLTSLFFFKEPSQAPETLSIFQADSDPSGLSYYYSYQAWLYYLLGKFDLAQHCTNEIRKNLSGIVGQIFEGMFWFLDSLTAIAAFDGAEDRDNLTLLLNRVETNQQALIQHWASHAPMNYQHKVDLVNAEKYRILGQKADAMDHYDQAITGATANGYVQEQALANELAAQFYLNWGKEKIAGVYLQEAYLCYDRWGAEAKTNDLAHRYAPMLQPLLPPTNAIDPLTTLHHIAPLHLSIHSSDVGTQAASGPLNTTLDLATILKSAQVLSDSTDLGERLEKLAAIMLQTSGAERLVLLLPNADNAWQVRVMATAENTLRVAVALADSPHVPVQLLQYVQHTQEILVVDALNSELPVVDPYLQQYPHRSVLCLPLLYQTKLTGLLYLEHHSVAGVFGCDRITMLNVLCTQAAISLENARLNQTLAQKLDVQAEKQQASEIQLRRLAENIPAMIFRYCAHPDGSNEILYVTHRSRDIFELEPEAIMLDNTKFWSMLHPEDVAAVAANAEISAQDLSPYHDKYRIVMVDGRVKWLEVFSRPERDDNGDIIWDGVCFDITERKQLEQQQNRLIQILQSTSDFVGICQPEKGILWQNQHFRELRPELKIAEEKVPISRLYPEWAFEIVKQEGLPTAIERGIWSGETALLTSSGAEIPTSQVIIAHKSEQGEVEYLSTILRDISDRKRAEAALQLSEARATAIFSQATVGIIEVNLLSGKLIRFNHYFCDLLGYSKSELQNMCLVDFTHPDDILECKQLIRALDTGKISNFSLERRLIHKNGSTVWVLASANKVQISKGQRHTGVAILQDISDRKVAEQALLQQQTHLRALLNNIPHFTWLKDAAGRYIAVNETYEEKCGITMDQIVGRTDDDVWSTELAQGYREDDAQVLASGERKVVVEQFSRADGTLGWLETTKTPFRDEQGTWAGIVGIAVDITEHKEAEAELQRTNTELIRATQHKSEFLASMSHELRTPLNAVLGYSQLMRRDRLIPSEHHTNLDTINRNGEHLLALINNILEMSKIEAGKTTINPKTIDFPEFLNDIYTTFNAKTQAKDLEFEILYPPDIPRYINVDDIKLRQILFNLLSNALKFTQDGQIRLHVQALEIIPHASSTTAHLQFSVSDTGPGIAAADLEDIFQPFIQSDAGKQHHQGTGLGLSISQKFAQVMGGNISANSTLGVGSTFRCDIYAQMASPVHESRHRQGHDSQGIKGVKKQQSTYRVLIVDDHVDNRDFLAQLLSASGFEIRQSGDGLQAVEMNESWQPHLICMDINMPRMDGLEAIRLIRQTSCPPKIIAITALAFSEDQQAALDAGCDAFLAKPFAVDELFEKIATLLNIEFTPVPQAVPPSPLPMTHVDDAEVIIQAGFLAMPPQWQEEMKQSIHGLDERSIRQLLTDVPAQYRGMVDAISRLLYDFKFDILIQILDEICPPRGS